MLLYVLVVNNVKKYKNIKAKGTGSDGTIPMAEEKEKITNVFNIWIR